MNKNPRPAVNPCKLVDGASAVVAHTFVRMRGNVTGQVDVHNARTEHARVVVTIGALLHTFWSAHAAQGVLEGFSAAKNTLLHLPVNIAPSTQDDYPQPTIAIDWTRRPEYAVMPRARVTDDKRRTLKWTDVYMGPITFQVLDRAAFNSVTDLLRDAHRTTVAVCLDGHKHRADPTRDDYKPQLEPHLL